MIKPAMSTLVIALSLACPLTHAQPVASVADVFTGDMLGTNLRYFESVAGIARESYGDQHIYRVQGCSITATAAGGTVSALSMELSPSCPVDLSSFIGDSYAPAANQPLTFGSFAEAAGELSFYSYCILSCGNAADPTVVAHWEGPRAANFTEVLLEVTLVGDAALNASSQWSEAMTAAKGEDFVMNTQFNCERDFDAQAQQAFAAVEVTAVTIGTELQKPGC